MRERLGELHILVNNAAILDMTGIEALTLERFEHVLDDQPDRGGRLHHGAAAVT